MTYDLLNSSVVVFGGQNGSTLRNDTWTLATAAPAHIETHPTGMAACLGASASFSVFATGQDVSYSWLRNGVTLSNGPTGTGSTISGADSADLSITDVSAADAGQYACRASNICGDDISAAATLTIIVGDLDGNGLVDLGDLANLLSHYGLTNATYSEGDLNGDTLIDLSDLALLLAAYGESCP